MTRMRFGYKPGIGPALKIMRNDADDPWTTPNDQFGRFAFNSETQTISYLLGILPFQYGGPSVYPPAELHLTGNAYWPTPYHLVLSRTNNNPGYYYEDHYFDAAGYFGLDYQPLAEVRRKVADSGNQFNGMRWEDVITRQGGPGVPGSGEARRYSAYDSNFVRELYPANMGGASIVTPPFVVGMNSGVAASRRDAALSVWEFPRENVAYSLPSAAPVSGQKVLTLRPTRAAMARPGFDLDATDARQYIFDSNRVPAKILAAGDMTLGAGATQAVMISAFAPLSPWTYVDAMTRRVNDPLIGNTFLHPTMPYQMSGPVNDDTSMFSYEVQEDRVVFRSTRDFAVVIRYLICADDEQGQSAGASRVLRGGPALGYIQICRPGAAEPPRLKDILVDSRLPYLPVIEQGYIPASAFNNVNTESNAGQKRGTHYAAPITFANDGSFKPFLKYTKVIEATGVGYNPHATRWWHSNDGGVADTLHWRYPSTSILAQVEDTAVTFFGNPNNPGEARWRPDGDGGSEFYYTTPVPTGVRYYVLAIPSN